MLWDPKKDRPVKVELDEVSKHIVRAADYIKKHGWCQSMLDTPDGRVCLMGALYASHPNIYKANMSIPDMVRTNINSAYVAIDGAYMRIRSHLNIEPARWNDRIAKSKEEVINLLETIAYSGGK